MIFNATERRIVLAPGTITVTARTIYSQWKLWSRNNPQFLPAFRVLGGEPLGGNLFVASYFFLINNWRIRPFEGNHNLTVEGNIIVEGAEHESPIVQTLGAFQVNVRYVVPVQAQAFATGGGTAPTVQQIRQELDVNSAALQAIRAKQEEALTKTEFIALQ